MSYSETSSSYSGTHAGISTSGGSSSSSKTYDTAVTISSPDDSDGLYAGYGGEAVAIGEDTLASGSLSATMVDKGAVATVEGTVTMLAASESTDEAVFASADTEAYIGGAELVFSYTEEGDYSEQGPTGSTAVSTSTTTAIGYDLQLYGHEDYDSGMTLTEEEILPSLEPGGSAPGVDLDGNVASLDFSVVAIADDSLVLVDAFVLAVEDEISVSAIHADLGIS